MKNFYLILIILIIILFFYKRNIENMQIDKRTYNGLKCQFGWSSDPTTSIAVYTGARGAENEFIGSPLGIDVLSACDCEDIFVGEKETVDPCNLPQCMKDMIPKWTGTVCGDEKKKQIIEKVKDPVNPTEFGSVNETNLVRAFIKHIRNISNDLLYIINNDTSEEKYDDLMMGEDDAFKNLIRPETITYNELIKMVQILKAELSEKLSKKK
jgi:hypothetical protein